MSKFLVIATVYTLTTMFPSSVYDSVGVCMIAKTAEECATIRSDVINNFKDRQDSKLYISQCVKFEITEDFNEENSVLACQMAAKKSETYGGADIEFQKSRKE